jgi:hypothetical protein
MASVSIGVSLTQETNELLNDIWKSKAKKDPGIKKSSIVEDSIKEYASINYPNLFLKNR